MTWDANKTYALILLPIVVAVGLFFFFKRETAVPGPIAQIGEREWRAEIADTYFARSKGLSDRDSLCNDCAMLFPFDEEGSYGFWMKDMRFPIDITWIRGGKIVHIEHRVPADFKGIMTPATPADAVLETNEGDLDDVPIGTEVFIRK